jgi:hypothetical protein
MDIQQIYEKIEKHFKAKFNMFELKQTIPPWPESPKWEMFINQEKVNGTLFSEDVLTAVMYYLPNPKDALKEIISLIEFELKRSGYKI